MTSLFYARAESIGQRDDRFVSDPVVRELQLFERRKRRARERNHALGGGKLVASELEHLKLARARGDRADECGEARVAHAGPP